MKAKQLRFAGIGLAIFLGGFGASWNQVERAANAQVSLSVGLSINSPTDFYGPLTPHGAWVNVGRYGRCWHPAEVAAGWRPYTVGHWEWTDCGWYWASDEPWATYHYGYWEFDPADGWVWVPGTEWSPAWVVWREAPDYIGWAPCGPGGAAVSDSFFVFTDIHRFHDRFGPRDLVFNDRDILRRSRPIGRFSTETRDFEGVRRRIAFNPGPSIDPIQRATGTRFTARPVTELVRQTAVPESARRNLAGRERTPNTQAPAVSQTGRERQRLYREAPAAPAPAATGRQEQRLYHEVPTSPPARQPSPTPAQPVPRRQPVPEVSRPPVAAPERPLPPTGRDNGRMQPQAPRREEAVPRAQPAPRVEPAPAPRPAPAQPSRSPEKRDEKKGDGQ